MSAVNVLRKGKRFCRRLVRRCFGSCMRGSARRNFPEGIHDARRIRAHDREAKKECGDRRKLNAVTVYW